MSPSTLLTILVLSWSSAWTGSAPHRVPEPAARVTAADEYQDLLLSSIKVWDDFQKRFKKLTSLTTSVDGDETVLSGTVEVYGVEGSSFEARFAGPTRINRLIVTLNPANPRDRRLRSDLSSKIARGQPDLEDWLPRPVRDARDRLLVERIEVDFEGNSPSKALLVSRIPLAFQPVPGIAIGMEAVEFHFAVTDPASRSRAGLTATLAGDVAIAGGSARLSGSITSRDSRETWTLAAHIGEVRLLSLVSAVAGPDALNGMVIPAELGRIALQSAMIEITQSSGTVIARATSDLGAVGMKAARGSTGTAFQFGVAPPASFRFASLAPELAVMDNLGLDNSVLVVASESMTADLPNLAGSTGTKVDRGVTMMGGFDLRGASPEVARMLQVDRVDMRGTIGTRLTDIRLEAGIQTQIQLTPNSDAAVLRGIVLRMVPGDAGTTLSLGGLVDVRADRQTLTFAADVGIDFIGPSFFVEGRLAAVDGTAAAYWSNPFGIAKGLHLRDLALMLGINLGAPIPMPILGLQAELVAGNPDRPDFRGRAALGIDPADPQKTVIDVAFDRLVIREILNAAAPEAMRGVPRELQYALDIGLHDARLTLVPAPGGATLFGVRYDPGFLVQGRAQVGEWAGELYVAVGESGLEARASMDAIHAEPWFSLTGARGQPHPFLNMRIEPGPNSYVAMSGSVMALGIQAEGDILMYGEGFDVYLGGKLFGGAFEASVEVAGGDLKNGGSLYAIAEMKNDLFRYMTENASRQIDAATKDMQAEISKAQRDVASAQASIRSLDGEIGAYRAQLERNRDQVCLDMKNSNADVRTAERDVAAARSQLDGIPNDPGVVAARNRLTAAEADVAAARTAVNGVEQDPGVVAARNRLVAAEADLNRARADVAAIDRDPGVVNARNNLTNAQNSVNSLNSQITAKNAQIDGLKRKLDNAAVWDKPGVVLEITAAGTQLAALETARATATGALTAARAVMDGSIRAAQETANAGISAAEGTVNLSRQAYDGAIVAARETANLALQAAEGSVSASRSAYNGLIAAGQATAQGALQVAEGTLQASQATVAAAHAACVAAPIEVDPRLAALIASQEVSIGTLQASNLFLEGIKQAATGTMVAADWIVRNGNPMGVVNIEYAKFEGCLAAVEGGRVSLEFRGTFAGSPIDGALALDFASPLDAVTYLAEYLISNKTAPTLPRTGGCQKPSFAGRPGSPGSRGLDAKNVPASPQDLTGAIPAITVPERPAGLGILRPGA